MSKPIERQRFECIVFSPSFLFGRIANSPNNDIINLDSDDDDGDESEPVIYHFVECADKTLKKIPDYYMANGYPPEQYVKLKPGTRVIARRKLKLFPVTQVSELGPEHLYDNDDSAFYAGIISESASYKNDCWYYMVFFDDGHAQYVSNRKIRVVFGDYGTKYVHPNAQQFYEYYFGEEVVEVNCEEDKNARVFLNNAFEMAKVVKRQDRLVLLDFGRLNLLEWLYIGSPRFEKVWTSIYRNKKLKKYHDANSTMIEVSSDSEEEEDDYVSPVKQPLPLNAEDPSQRMISLRPKKLIDGYKEMQDLGRQHICNPKCVLEFERNDKIFDFDPLKRPLLAGWKRKISGSCVYVTPCGRSFATIDSTHRYLLNTNSKLSIDCFTFSVNIDCMMEVHSYSGSNRIYYLNDVSSIGSICLFF